MINTQKSIAPALWEPGRRLADKYQRSIAVGVMSRRDPFISFPVISKRPRGDVS
jgi:hypothetical protein